MDENNLKYHCNVCVSVAVNGVRTTCCGKHFCEACEYHLLDTLMFSVIKTDGQSVFGKNCPVYSFGPASEISYLWDIDLLNLSLYSEIKRLQAP